MLGNVGILMATVFFMYDVLAVQLFSGINYTADGEMNEFMNFQNFGRTFFTLFFTIVAAGLTNATAQKVFTVDYASQADVKLFVVDYASQADLCVFRVDYASQAKGNEGQWFWVDYASQADKKVFWVDYASQADLKIFFVDYASQAEWRSQQKKHLMY